MRLPRRPDYVIDENQPGRDRDVARFHKRWFWYPENDDGRQRGSGSVDLLFGHRRYGHGWGFTFGRNGSESDVGLDVFAGRLMSLFTRHRTSWTKRFRTPDDYHARHYGMRIDRTAMRFEWGVDPMGGTRNNGRRLTVNKHTFLGRQRIEKEELDFGVCQIPMPEGIYPAEWKRQRYVSHYVGWLGVLRDRILGPRIGKPSYWIDVPGGIPVEGKGENSWDCGMDGIFGTGGTTLHDAIGNVAAAALRDRDRYGGPHNLTEPTSVAEAERSA